MVTSWWRLSPLQVWVISQRIIPSNTLPQSGVEPGQRKGQWDTFILSLSCHDPGHGENRLWDTFILPLGYHDPGHGENRQWDTFILPLGYHDPGHVQDRQWDTFILSLCYHDPGLREDRQWDTFVLSLSYHDPGHGENRQWDTFILPQGYHDPGHGQDRQWNTFILPLGYHDPGHVQDRQWNTFILPLGYHDPGHVQDRQWDTFILPIMQLSWPGPWREKTVRCIHSPTVLSWPGSQRGQTVRYIRSPTGLSWPGPQRGQTVRYIRPPTGLSWLPVSDSRRGSFNEAENWGTSRCLASLPLSPNRKFLLELTLRTVPRRFCPPSSSFYWRLDSVISSSVTSWGAASKPHSRSQSLDPRQPRNFWNCFSQLLKIYFFPYEPSLVMESCKRTALFIANYLRNRCIWWNPEARGFQFMTKVSGECKRSVKWSLRERPTPG